jgi:hypothetical protein
VWVGRVVLRAPVGTIFLNKWPCARAEIQTLSAVVLRVRGLAMRVAQRCCVAAIARRVRTRRARVELDGSHGEWMHPQSIQF